MGTDALDIGPVSAAGTGDPDAPAGTDVGHVHLEVSSLEAFRDCYIDTIGFEMQMSIPDAVFVSAGDYHHHIGANTWNKRSEPTSGRGLSWFEVVFPDVETLHAVRERVAASQYPLTATENGVEMTGPDGIAVRFRVD
jgi:catechol 2,3-dioxygenase